MSEIAFSPIHTVNYVRVHDPRNVSEIKPYQNELEKCRKDDLESTMKFVTEIRRSLESLKIEVSGAKEQRDTSYLRRRMLDIEEKMSRLKETIKEELSKLMKDEINLLKELQLLERRIEDWSKPINMSIFKPIKQSSYRVQSGHDPTAEFQKFLHATGGHCGGWEEQDHLFFLRERRKYNGKPKFLSIVHSLLPDLSYDDIVQHEDWYLRYESLKSDQKDAIKKWRMEKETCQEEKVTATEKSEKNEGKSSKKFTRQRNIAERIKEWKRQQMSRKKEEEERQKEEQERAQQERRRKKKEIDKNKKAIVNQYKADKLRKLREEILSLEESKQSENLKIKKSILLKAFRTQDLKFIEKKQTMRLQSESKAKERVERLNLGKPGLRLVPDRDPQRIFQPTLIWSEHCRPTERKDKLNPVFDLNSIPRLAVPEWRKELK